MNPNRSARKIISNFAKSARKQDAVGKSTYEGFNDRWADHDAPRPDRNKRSVWTIPTVASGDEHFAMFPPKLIIPMVLAGCPAGGTVLDPFVGSGTTAMVAQGLERNAIGIELNPKYVAMARERIAGKHGVFAEVAW